MLAKFLRQLAGFLMEEGSYVLPRAEFVPPASLQGVNLAVARRLEG